ncbi:unnamed protein product [Tetraodon nigroviridis]|uniref:(spotted green pufferfish) hypothetical protein n=1 Tax=Tetraodon nigroviridis TaxID=99883 RepID=Q4S2Y3_TETNG|nr:unnamed protein product [Tetraodon nigroviridis]
MGGWRRKAEERTGMRMRMLHHTIKSIELSTANPEVQRVVPPSPRGATVKWGAICLLTRKRQTNREAESLLDKNTGWELGGNRSTLKYHSVNSEP